MSNYDEKIKKRFDDKSWYSTHEQNHDFFEPLIILSAKIGYILPSFLKKIFISIIDILGLWISRFSKIFFSPLYPKYLLTGNENHCAKKMCILYKGPIGSLDVILNFFNIKYNTCQIEQLKKERKNKIKKMKKSESYSSFDFLIIRSDVFFQRYLKKKGFIIIPEYVSFHLDITSSLEEILKRASPDVCQDIEKAKRTKYEYEIRDDLDTFRFFYDHMYVPFIKWKHEEKGRIVSFATICHLAARGAKLLILTHNTQRIFGGIFLKENTIMRTYYAGLMNGKFSHIHNGIMSLSYYYMIKIAKKLECKSIDFGTAPPLTNDGLYLFKKKWGMKIVETSPLFSDIFAINIPKRDHSRLKQFIDKNPVHYLNDNRLDVLQNVDLKN